jgi:hypothetical protein
MSDAKGAEFERGLILKLLVTEYPRELSLAELAVRMKIQMGAPLSEHRLRFHLNYLAEAGYLRLREVRGDDGKILFARALKLGIDLRDERIPPDPGIELPPEIK